MYKNKCQIKKIYKRRKKYFFISIILCACLIQFLCGSLFNLTRYFVLNKKIALLEDLNSKAAVKNKQLRDQLQEYSSYRGVEELARNNLRMVGKNEVLVLIKNQPQQYQ